MRMVPSLSQLVNLVNIKLDDIFLSYLPAKQILLSRLLSRGGAQSDQRDCIAGDTKP